MDQTRASAPHDMQEIMQEILRLTEARGPQRSICPTEVARALETTPGEAWRARLGAVRRSAALLAGEGRIDILHKGKPIDPSSVRGVIRLRIRLPEPDA